jgi:hypothetical protein
MKEKDWGEKVKKFKSGIDMQMLILPNISDKC